jgi:hypothetical protein
MDKLDFVGGGFWCAVGLFQLMKKDYFDEDQQSY